MAQAPNLTSLSLSMDVDQIGYHQLVSERLAKARILAEPVLTNLVELELERQDVCKDNGGLRARTAHYVAQSDAEADS